MPKRKRRVRKHVIADLSLNRLEYYLLHAGFTIEAIRSDYGYDGVVFTFSDSGEIENGNVYVQLKATEKIDELAYADGAAFKFVLSAKDINLWAGDIFPVILVLFDVEKEAAYWLHLQQYISAIDIDLENLTQDSLTVRIEKSDIVDSTAPPRWRKEKEVVLENIREFLANG